MNEYDYGTKQIEPEDALSPTKRLIKMKNQIVENMQHIKSDDDLAKQHVYMASPSRAYVVQPV